MDGNIRWYAIPLAVNDQRLRVVLSQLGKDRPDRMNLMAHPLARLVAGLAEHKHLAIGARRIPELQEQMQELVVASTILLDVDHESKVVVTRDLELLLFEKLDPIGLRGSRLVSEADKLATVVQNGSFIAFRLIGQNEVAILHLADVAIEQPVDRE
jgi:hypothetical protein